jgi:hypothetical protein
MDMDIDMESIDDDVYLGCAVVADFLAAPSFLSVCVAAADARRKNE